MNTTNEQSPLYALRTARGLSLRDLAERTGYRVSHETLRKWERDLVVTFKRKIHERLHALAEALGVDVGDMTEALGVAREDRQTAARDQIGYQIGKLLEGNIAATARACGTSPATVRDVAALRCRPTRAAPSIHLALAAHAGVDPEVLKEALGLAPTSSREAARWRLLAEAARIGGWDPDTNRPSAPTSPIVARPSRRSRARASTTSSTPG